MAGIVILVCVLFAMMAFVDTVFAGQSAGSQDNDQLYARQRDEDWEDQALMEQNQWEFDAQTHHHFDGTFAHHNHTD